jgi:hypothetical protein
MIDGGSSSSSGRDGTEVDSKLMKELRIKDEKLTKEMYDTVLNPTDMLNVTLKKFHYRSSLLLSCPAIAIDKAICMQKRCLLRIMYAEYLL